MVNVKPSKELQNGLPKCNPLHRQIVYDVRRGLSAGKPLRILTFAAGNLGIKSTGAIAAFAANFASVQGALSSSATSNYAAKMNNVKNFVSEKRPFKTNFPMSDLLLSPHLLHIPHRLTTNDSQPIGVHSHPLSYSL